MESSGQSHDRSQEDTRGAKYGIYEAGSAAQFWEGVEARFLQLCEVELCLDEETSFQALRLLEQNKDLLLADIGSAGWATAGETARFWTAWILFIVKRLGVRTAPGTLGDKMEGRRSFTLSEVLKATNLSLMDFFKDPPQVLTSVGPRLKKAYGDCWEERLMVKEIQVDFYYLTVLFSYYKRLYQSFFLSGDAPGASENDLLLATNGTSECCGHLRFGWLLFLLLRIHVLRRFADLVTNVNGLLAVVVRSLPATFVFYLGDFHVKLSLLLLTLASLVSTFGRHIQLLLSEPFDFQCFP